MTSQRLTDTLEMTTADSDGDTTPVGDASEEEEDEAIERMMLKRRLAKRRKATGAKASRPGGTELDEEVKRSKPSVGSSSVAGPGWQTSEEDEEETYRQLVEAEKKPLPAPKFCLVESADDAGRQKLQAVKLQLHAQPQDNIAFRLGRNRPVYLLFQLKKPYGFLPSLAFLHTGEMAMEQLKRLGFIEDMYQQGGKPRKPKPDQPMISQNKAVLSLGDVECLRRMGPALVRRARELSQMGTAAPRFVTLGRKDDADGEFADPSQTGGELGPSRLLMYPDERGQVLFQISRIAASSSGGSLESTNSKFTLEADELEALVYWVEEVFVEAHRLASHRVAVNTPLTTEMRETFHHGLVELLVEKLGKEMPAGAKTEEERSRFVRRLVAETIRCTPSAVLKRESNVSRGSRENFASYHLELCSSPKLAQLAARVHGVAKTEAIL